MELQKKEIKKIFSFGIEGINDEWEQIDSWGNFTKYKNQDNMIIVTHKITDPQSLDDILHSMFGTTVGDSGGGEETLIVASDSVLKNIKHAKELEEK